MKRKEITQEMEPGAQAVAHSPSPGIPVSLHLLPLQHHREAAGKGIRGITDTHRICKDEEHPE